MLRERKNFYETVIVIPILIALHDHGDDDDNAQTYRNYIPCMIFMFHEEENILLHTTFGKK